MKLPALNKMLWLVMAGLALNAQAADGLPKPTPQQYAWHEQERLMFTCLDPCTWQGREYDNHSTPLNQINPAQLDTEQWCRAAKLWGAKEILFVAKHTGGFCWWQTATTDYSVKSIPWKGGKGDVLAELAASCKRHGLNLGIYVYSGDEQWGAGIDSGGRTADPAKQEAYNKVYRQQMTEVLSRYGKIIEIWFDGGCIIPVNDIIKKYQPKALLFGSRDATIRWPGTESGTLPYPSWSTADSHARNASRDDAAIGAADGDKWLPVECDTPLYDHYWFWSAAKEPSRKSLDRLMDIYCQSVGRGGVLLLNSTPTTNGLIPSADLERYKAFGEAIAHRFDQPLARGAGKGTEIVLSLKKATTVNQAVIMEDYRQGQRIREYEIDVATPDGWRTVAKGSSVGRMRIQVFPAAVTDRVRLRLTRAAAEPLIRRFAVYHEPWAYHGRSAVLSLVTGKSAKASSEFSAGYAAAMLVDGDESTRWGAKEQDKAAWIEIDLEKPTTFARATIKELADRIRKFRIEYRSDTADPWRAAYEGAAVGERFACEFPPVTARYVRLNILEATAGCTIWEFQLFPPATPAVVCGTWKAGDVKIHLDLSPFIDIPRDYLVEAQTDSGGSVPAISAAHLLFNGVDISERHLGRLSPAAFKVSQTQMVTPETRTILDIEFKDKPSGAGRFTILPNH